MAKAAVIHSQCALQCSTTRVFVVQSAQVPVYHKSIPTGVKWLVREARGSRTLPAESAQPKVEGSLPPPVASASAAQARYECQRFRGATSPRTFTVEQAQHTLEREPAATSAALEKAPTAPAPAKQARPSLEKASTANLVLEKAATALPFAVPNGVSASLGRPVAAQQVIAEASASVEQARHEHQRVWRAGSSRSMPAEQPTQPELAKSSTAPLPVNATQAHIVHRGGSATVASAAAPSRKRVTVVAPGGGTFANREVYQGLARSAALRVEIVGQARAEYDRYPEAFDHGKPAPNLESFAEDMLAQGVVGRTDVLVVGSRGGQVCLPHLWRTVGAAVPPAVVINGGCAMKLPKEYAVHWPDEAVVFLIIGGRDNFKSKFTDDEYFQDTKSRVPARNSTTAVLYVNEMEHMPQQGMLHATLQPAIRALLLWQESRRPPLEDFQLILASLSAGAFSGRLAYTAGKGEWKEMVFGAPKPAPRACGAPAAPAPHTRSQSTPPAQSATAAAHAVPRRGASGGA